MKFEFLANFLGGNSKSRTRELLELMEALLSARGEASGVAIAREILLAYALLPEEDRLEVLIKLGEQFGPNPKQLQKIIGQYLEAPGAVAALALHSAAESRRQELIRRLNSAPGGTGALLRMREDVMRHLSAQPVLRAVDGDFAHLLSSWFGRGFLVLKRIDWSTPAHILEKIIRYEAVHEITSWDDLRRRLLPPDRRCFAFFHPALPDEPLIFVEVALTGAMPDSIGPLLAQDRKPTPAQDARTAVFYSISNCQNGLRGVSFGSFLIKQVAEDLKLEFPALKRFVTLSPIPGFGAWLAAERKEKTSSYLTAEDKKTLELLDEPGWHDKAQNGKILRPVLQRVIAHYFLQAKTKSGKPVDPVARFHLGNGANLERINWLGDVSAKGLREAAGFMVNYLYVLDQIEHNHEAFVASGEIAVSRQVRKLLRS